MTSVPPPREPSWAKKPTRAAVRPGLSPRQEPTSEELKPDEGGSLAGAATRWAAWRGRFWPAGGRKKGEFAARLLEKRRAKRRVWWGRLAWVGGVAGLLGAVMAVIFFSPWLSLDAKQIKIISDGGSFDSAAVQGAMGEFTGQALASLDLGAVRARVEDIPGVAKVQARRDWPRGLTLRVAGRIPVAIGNSAGQSVLLDAHGVSLGTPGEADVGLPAVTVPLNAGEVTAAALESVLKVLGDIPGPLRTEVQSAGAKDGSSVELRLRTGQLLRWGGAGESALKAQVFSLLRRQYAPVYDLSDPRHPVSGPN